MTSVTSLLAGQLDNRFDVKIADNRLKMGNVLELHKAEAEALEGKDGPPLTMAIALLEDRDGYVKIDVPVEGKLDDPNFRVVAALNPDHHEGSGRQCRVSDPAAGLGAAGRRYGRRSGAEGHLQPALFDRQAARNSTRTQRNTWENCPASSKRNRSSRCVCVALSRMLIARKTRRAPTWTRKRICWKWPSSVQTRFVPT